MIPFIISEWEKETKCLAYGGDASFSNYVERWLRVQETACKETTAATYRGYAQRYVLPALGDLRVCDFKRVHLQAFADDLLEQELSVSSVRKILVVVYGALREAYCDDAITTDFRNAVRLPKARKFEGAAYTAEEAVRLLEAAAEEGEPLRAAVVLALCYGLRRSEVLGMRWKDVDFEAGVLRVCNTVVQDGGIKIESERTKTEKSRRVIPLIPETVPYLKQLKERQETSGLELDKICCWPDGDEVRGDFLTRALHKVQRRADLREIRFHDLRHSAASLLIGAGVSAKAVQEFLGHEDIQTTLGTYTHLTGEEQRKTSAKMGEILGR